MKWKLMDDAISYSDKLKLAKFCLTSNQFTNGKKVRKIEKEWSEWLGCKHSLFVSSGSTANFLLIAAVKELYNLKDGDKVLVPACTWMTNVAPIIQLGLKPIFCDIQLSDFSFDETELEYVAKKHKDIKLIFVTHLLGFSSKSRINGALERHFPNALILDDVCESHGCLHPKKENLLAKVGSDSLGATFSTYFGHHLTSIEGGFVCTNNTELYDLMKMKRSHGMARESMEFERYAAENPGIDKQFLFITDGYNFRNTELNAVLCSSQLKKLNKSIKIRNENYAEFCSLIRSFDQYFYPINYSLSSSNFCLPFVCRTEELKNKLVKKLSEHGIEYRPIISGNLLRHPFLKGYSICTKRKVTNADIIHDKGFYIGNSQFVNKKHLKLLEQILDNEI